MAAAVPPNTLSVPEKEASDTESVMSSTHPGMPGQAFALEPNPKKLVVINEAEAMEVCETYRFLLELLQDMVALCQETQHDTAAAIAKSDYHAFQCSFHGIKGAALNLHLPALSRVAADGETLARALATKTPPVANLSQEQAAARLGLFRDALLREFERLKVYMKVVEQRAALEPPASDDDDDF